MTAPNKLKGRIFCGWLASRYLLLLWPLVP